MNILIALFALVGSTVAIIMLSSIEGLAGWVKLFIIVPLVLLTVYCLARIPSGEQKEAAAEPRIAQALDKQKV